MNRRDFLKSTAAVAALVVVPLAAARWLPFEFSTTQKYRVGFRPGAPQFNVYLNGVLQTEGLDYTVVSEHAIEFTPPAVAGPDTLVMRIERDL